MTTARVALAEAPLVPLRHLVEFNPRPRLITSEESCYLPMEAISEFGDVDSSRMRPTADLLQGYSFIRDGDVAYAKVTPCFENGKGMYARDLPGGYAFATTEITVLRPRAGLDARYLAWVLQSGGFRSPGESHMSGAGGLRRVPEAYAASFRIPRPSIAVQRVAADFLDRETAQIDAFIAKNEELIALLIERREGAVAKAVTQGVSIGPTLRSCGVAWIGAVPTHWDVRPLRWAARMRTGTTPTGENVFAEDPGEPWFRPDDLDLTGAPSMATRWLSPAAAEQGKPAPAGSTLVCSIGATVGKAGRIIEAAYFNQQITAVWWNMNSEYLYWALSAARSAMKGLSVGNTLPILNNSKLGELRLPVPPEAEQIAIVAELRVQTDQIDAAIATAQRSTDLARERRAALISAAVTGKIDVGVSA